MWIGLFAIVIAIGLGVAAIVMQPAIHPTLLARADDVIE
jgi:hypothetical protein